MKGVDLLHKHNFSKNYGIKISETEIFKKSLELNVFEKNIGWKYNGLMNLFNFYYNLSTEGFNTLVKIYNKRGILIENKTNKN